LKISKKKIVNILFTQTLCEISDAAVNIRISSLSCSKKLTLLRMIPCGSIATNSGNSFSKYENESTKKKKKFFDLLNTNCNVTY